MLVTATISAFDAQRWVINTARNEHILVNEAGAQLFHALATGPTMEAACQHFNQALRVALDAAQFERVVQGRFGGYAILRADQAEARLVPAAPYIALKVTLLSPAVAARLAAPFQSLYRPRVFWPLLIGIGGVAVCGLGRAANHLPVSLGSYWITLPLLYASMLLHELGHIAACLRARVKPGGVGFGFYGYVFPVLYADITAIWLASRSQRIIANLAGIFAQLLFAAGLEAGFALTQYQPLQLAGFSITIAALWQFNPFIRRDGYWMLSELTNTPNLMLKAKDATRRALRPASVAKLARSRGRGLLDKRVLLVLYGVVNTLLFVGLGTVTLLRHLPETLAFPATCWHQLSRLATGEAIAPVTHDQLLGGASYLLWGRVLMATVINRRPRPTG